MNRWVIEGGLHFMIGAEGDILYRADNGDLVPVGGTKATGKVPVIQADGTVAWETQSGGGLTDGDKGDITVGGSGTTLTIDNDAVTYAKMQNVSAASKLLGRGDSGAGDPQEITLGSNLSMSGTTLNASTTGTPAFAGARVFNNANISITTSGTPQFLTFNSETFDSNGYHDTSTNTDRLTVPSGKGGYYHIFACVSFAANGTGYRQVYFEVDGTTPIVVHNEPTITAGGVVTVIAVSTVYLLNATQYVRCGVVQTGASPLNVVFTSAYSPMFGLALIGA